MYMQVNLIAGTYFTIPGGQFQGISRLYQVKLVSR